MTEKLLNSHLLEESGTFTKTFIFSKGRKTMKQMLFVLLLLVLALKTAPAQVPVYSLDLSENNMAAIPSLDGYELNGSFTISVWVKKNINGGGTYFWAQSYKGYAGDLYTTQIKLRIGGGETGQVIPEMRSNLTSAGYDFSYYYPNTALQIPDTSWHYITYVIDRTAPANPEHIQDYPGYITCSGNIANGTEMVDWTYRVPGDPGSGVVWAYDYNAELRVYVDGKLGLSSNDLNPPDNKRVQFLGVIHPTNDWGVGGGETYTSPIPSATIFKPLWDGQLADFRIWETAFDSLQIDQNMNSPVAIGDNLLVSLPLDGHLLDVSGNDNNAFDMENYSGTDDVTANVAYIEDRPMYLSSGESSLPVELQSFSIKEDINKLTLYWTTASETDNSGFEIWRKNSDNEYRLLSDYKTNETLAGQGNTSTEHSYTFVDEHLTQGVVYSYRLYDVDYSGHATKIAESSASLSPENILPPEVANPSEFYLSQNFPNPFNPSTKIQFNFPVNEGTTKVAVYDITGRLIKTLLDGHAVEGLNTVVWDGTDDRNQTVTSGVYIYSINNILYNSSRKMLLVR